MLKRLLKTLRERSKDKVKKKLRKKLKRKLLLLALAGGSVCMVFAHRKLILAKLLHKETPKGECPRKHLFGKKK